MIADHPRIAIKTQSASVSLGYCLDPVLFPWTDSQSTLCFSSLITLHCNSLVTTVHCPSLMPTPSTSHPTQTLPSGCKGWELLISCILYQCEYVINAYSCHLDVGHFGLSSDIFTDSFLPCVISMDVWDSFSHCGVSILLQMIIWTSAFLQRMMLIHTAMNSFSPDFTICVWSLY